MAAEEEDEVNNNNSEYLCFIINQSNNVALTDHPLWGHEVRPDLDVLKLYFDERGPFQLVYRQLSEPIQGTEEHHLWVGSSIQGVTDQTPALQEDFTLVLPKRPGTGDTDHPPDGRQRGRDGLLYR